MERTRNMRELSCGSIVGYPRLKLEGDQNAGVYNLTIKDASLTDDGEYQCQVGPYGKIRAIRANAHLVVIFVIAKLMQAEALTYDGTCGNFSPCKNVWKTSGTARARPGLIFRVPMCHCV
ncbi:hypothetical protein PV327_002194 [Microctonus hyperodae]|uniref:Immunoglobulin V-set domain-containing protein n=1 Tax=Microctonus hyperodae TaxID=165561 RepID=A0AA39FF83_MICHY|nr:hypothetical protein PV327_002194 [Microctonus hyperodae]